MVRTEGNDIPWLLRAVDALRTTFTIEIAVTVVVLLLFFVRVGFATFAGWGPR